MEHDDVNPSDDPHDAGAGELYSDDFEAFGPVPEPPDGAWAERSLRGKFLVASSSLIDPHFARSIILIVRHDADGALGVVINRPLGVTLEEACADEVDAAEGVRVPLFHGGPCTGPLIAVHNLRSLAQAEADLAGEEAEDVKQDHHAGGTQVQAVADDVYFCSRREALEALMKHLAHDAEKPVASTTAVKFVAGYAGWASGQLESELDEGAWQLVAAEASEVFAGGDERHPVASSPVELPPGALSVTDLAGLNDTEPAATLAAGIRQWVRLRTRANLLRIVPARLIPPDPSAN